MDSKSNEKPILSFEFSEDEEDTKQVNLEERWVELADDLYKVSRKRKRYERKYKNISKELRDLSDHRTTKRGRYEYKLIKRKGPIQYSEIPELQGVDLEPYRKEKVDNWQLRVYK